MNDKPDDWYILGAGSVGQLCAALLHRAARPVCLLLRDRARLDAYRHAGGITLHEDARVEQLQPPAALAADVATVAQRLLVVTKAQQTQDALAPFAARRDEALTIALLQNGMGVAEQVQAAFPHAHIYCLVTMIGAWRDGPFSVHRAGRGHTLVGRYRSRDVAAAAPDTDAEALARSLSTPDLAFEASPDILTAQWRKLAVNCVINPLTALLDIPNGQVPTDPRAAPLIPALCDESSRVAAADGVELPAAELRATVNEVCRLTASNYNSMRRDLNEGRASEIDYITGYVLARARAPRHTLPHPPNPLRPGARARSRAPRVVNLAHTHDHLDARVSTGERSCRNRRRTWMFSAEPPRTDSRRSRQDLCPAETRARARPDTCARAVPERTPLHFKRAATLTEPRALATFGQ